MKAVVWLVALALVPTVLAQDNNTVDFSDDESQDSGDNGWNPFWVTIIAIAVFALIAIIVLAARR